MHGVRLLRDVIRLTCKESGFGVGVYTAAEHDSCSGELIDQMSFISKWIMAVGAALGTQLACDAKMIASGNGSEHLDWLIRSTVRATKITTGIDIEEKVKSIIDINKTFTMATTPLEGTSGLIPIESVERAAIESSMTHSFQIIKSNLRHILFISCDDLSSKKIELFGISTTRLLSDWEANERTALLELQWNARNLLVGHLHSRKAPASRSVEVAILAAAIRQNRISIDALRAVFLEEQSSTSIDVSSDYSS